jgi:drug/metabolite transporter (DMT)-like permease
MSERVEAGPAVTARGRHGVSTDLMMLLAITIWGVNFTAVKVALRSMEPLAFNAVRFTLATIVTFVVLAWQARATGRPELTRPPARRDFLVIALISFMGNSVYQVLFIQGMARTSPGNASLIMATAPIWVAILGFLLRIERINRLMFGGILLSFAGIVLLVMGGGNVALGSANVVGDLLILGCAVLWAVYTVASKPLLTRVSPLSMTAWSMLAGTIPLILFAIPDLQKQDWSAVEPIAWASLFYSAVLSVAVGYVIWYASVQRVGNARTAVYSNLTPVVAILFAWATLGATLAPVQLLGGAIVLVGLVVTRRGRAK